ncbi:hypothetical protein ABQE62_05945 [Mycolicibacterium fortuitum]
MSTAVSRAAKSAYLAVHPGHEAGAVAAGYIAALRVARAADPHAIPVQTPAARAAMSRVDIAEVERWVTTNWTEIEEAA